jgi:hypothetical protein
LGELAAAGITNFDLLPFQQNFNPTNLNTIQGRALTASNIQWIARGAYFSNSIIQCTNIPDARNATMFIVWHYPDNTNPPDGFAYVGGFASSSSYASSFYLHNVSSWDAQTVRQGNIQCPNGLLLTNLILYPLNNGWNNGYFTPKNVKERQVYTFSNFGTNSACYRNGAQCKMNGYETAFGTSLNAPLTNSLDILQLGSDSLTNSAFLPFLGVIDDVLIVWTTNLATTNLVLAGNNALRWLDKSRVNRVWVGDSTWITFNGVSSPQQFEQHLIGDNCYHNWAQNGMKADTWVTTLVSSNLDGLGNVAWVNQREIMYQTGINDFFTYPGYTSLPGVWQYVTNFVTIAASKGYTVTIWTPYQIWTNAVGSVPWALWGQTNMTAFCNLIQDNRQLFGQVYRRDLYVTQSMMNTNNGFSLDGVYFGDTVHNSAAGLTLLANLQPNPSSVVNYDGVVVAVTNSSAKGYAGLDGSAIYGTLTNNTTGNATAATNDSAGNNISTFYLPAGRVNTGTTNAVTLTSFTATFTTAFTDTNYTATATGNGFAVAGEYVSNKTTTNCVFNMTVATGLIDWLVVHQ